MELTYNDGGRAAAGFKNTEPDCSIRAICIATGLRYMRVYMRIKRDYNRVREILGGEGWEWVDLDPLAAQIPVSALADEPGVIIIRFDAHYTVLDNGVILDTYDPTRDGTRIVHGYWRKKRPDGEEDTSTRKEQPPQHTALR